MIKLQGKLKTKVIHGRNGDFTVGTIVTDIGEFALKDPLLDQFTEGEYEGEFVVAKIFPHSYVFGGGVRVEVMAVLDSLDIDSAQEKPMPDEPIPDPMESEPQPISERSEPPVPSKQSAPEMNQSDTSDDIDMAVFGTIEVSNQIGDIVKLDPTQPRKLMRQQAQALHKLGYSFKAKQQAFIKEA